ncbi:hypothetical protein AGMMS49574_21540 [Bacteroidia bacterium]|nr:hypothetical protein AGMMS49574_21540 [Bacteroidia bacterium]
MKKNSAILILFLAFAQLSVAQSDTLTGILFNEKNKPLKKYPITLGKDGTQTVTTNNKGVFVFHNANLEDTLYILLKNKVEQVTVPVAGYNYITVKLAKGHDFVADRNSSPYSYLSKIMDDENNKAYNSNIISRDVIVNSGCQDIICLLNRMSGIIMRNDGSVEVRAGMSSLNMSNEALVVLDGIVVDNSTLRDFSIQDLMEISILKDATGYGSRGANGAIILKSMQ